MPTQTLRANIDYFQQPAYTKSGYVGIKVWIYKGEVLPEKRLRELDAVIQQQQEQRRGDRPDRRRFAENPDREAVNSPARIPSRILLPEKSTCFLRRV